MAFTQNSVPTLIRQPQNGKVQINNAAGQTPQTVYTAGPNGSKISSLIATSSDTSSRDVQVSLTRRHVLSAGDGGGAGGRRQLVGRHLRQSARSDPVARARL